MQALIALVSGLLFGLGLIVSGMANPAKVLGFLDLAGAWDPSLALVMGGAIAAAAPAFAWARQRQRTLLGQPLSLPANRDITPRMLIGSAIFGIGWGLLGLCPGPAWLLLASGEAQVWGFVAAMLAGMALHHRLERSRR